jgi:sigma-B regulation protein RsbU (phosphoserine phosphatase)
MFVTAHYGVLDTMRHRLTYASAGHNLALHARSGECDAAELTAHGLALGITRDTEFEQKTVDLLPGDVILFYTDGTVDTLNEQGEAFGDARLQEVLCEHRAEPAEAIADAIDGAVQEWAGGVAQYDDLTLIVIRRSPAGEQDRSDADTDAD